LNDYSNRKLVGTECECTGGSGDEIWEDGILLAAWCKSDIVA